MDSRNDIREFLTTRRARLTPEQAGLPNFGGRRRVPGLRREEVALLAGMSVEYYVRLERGNATGVSENVLEGISRALQLDEAEHAHLYDLIRAANSGIRPQQRRSSPRLQQVRPALQQTLDAMTSLPVIVQNGRLDIVAANRLGFALFSEMYVQPQRPANFARSSSSTSERRPSTATGRMPRSKPLPCCGARPDARRTTALSPTSSESSRPAASSSAPCGHLTM